MRASLAVKRPLTGAPRLLRAAQPPRRSRRPRCEPIRGQPGREARGPQRSVPALRRRAGCWIRPCKRPAGADREARHKPRARPPCSRRRPHCCPEGSSSICSDEAAFVFFGDRCTGIGETNGAIFNSTSFSANRRTVQRARPSGAGDHAKAISRASKAPPKVTLGGVVRARRSKAVSMPSSTKRCLRCSTVRGVIPSAAATSATFHRSPCLNRGPSRSCTSSAQTSTSPKTARRCETFTRSCASVAAVRRGCGGLAGLLRFLQCAGRRAGETLRPAAARHLSAPRAFAAHGDCGAQ